MIRITKLTDYGIVLLSHIAQDSQWRTYSVKELAAEAHVPEPTVGKLLKALTKSGLLVSQRGVKGGYTLSRRPEEISVAQIISAIDGPIAITDCSSSNPVKCELERLCPVRTNWQRINVAIRDSLDNITLAEMVRPLPNNFVPLNGFTLKTKLKTNTAEALELCQP
jgi:FeS assembly SUF system regulator